MDVMDQMESHRQFLEAQGLTSDPEIPVVSEADMYAQYLEALKAVQGGTEEADAAVVGGQQ